MPMPNRHIQDANGYRYAYQGQEKDPETGKEAFELRLWDGRIGRWLTTDPMGQFFSPYLGMGNNPINNIDENGGYVYIYGKRITKNMLRRLLANNEAGYLRKYLNNPHKHIHIANVSGLGAFGYTSPFAVPGNGGETLTSDMVKGHSKKHVFNHFIGIAKLGKGDNWFITVDLDLASKKSPYTSEEETIFHEGKHVDYLDQGIPYIDPSGDFMKNHHERLSGTPEGGISPFYDSDPEFFNKLPIYKFRANMIFIESNVNFFNSLLLIPDGNRSQIQYDISPLSPDYYKDWGNN